MKIVNYLVSFLSRSPVLSITEDKSFHEILIRSNMEFTIFRYSIFSLGIGSSKIYILTYSKKDGFNWYKILPMSEIVKLPSEEEVLEKVRNYSDHIVTKESNEVEIEIDFLKYKINEEENRKNIASGKINNYTAIVLVLIPLIFASGLKLVLDLKNVSLIILVIAILYSIINMIIFILDFYKVKSFLRSSFGDLKKSQNHLNKLAESYYHDWYSIKSESCLFVTYVRNVERYMKITMIFIIIFILLTNINVSNQFSLTPKVTSYQQNNYTYDINISKSGDVRKRQVGGHIVDGGRQ